MEISLDGRSCLLAAVLLLTIPFPWLFSAVVAAMFHELCHLAALKLTGTKVWRIKIGICRAEIETEPMHPRCELICAAAGPAGSLLLFLFLYRIPRIALCAFCQGVFNLLPIYPLDGGRVLRATATLLVQRRQREKFLAKKRISGYNSATIIK